MPEHGEALFRVNSLNLSRLELIQVLSACHLVCLLSSQTVAT